MKYFLSLLCFSIVATGCSFSAPEKAANDSVQNTQIQTSKSLPKQTFSMDTINQANTRDNCLTIVDGVVYDLSGFILSHPGGVVNIMEMCGRDGTDLFAQQHGSSRQAQRVLQGLEVGILAE